MLFTLRSIHLVDDYVELGEGLFQGKRGVACYAVLSVLHFMSLLPVALPVCKMVSTLATHP